MTYYIELHNTKHKTSLKLKLKRKQTREGFNRYIIGSTSYHKIIRVLCGDKACDCKKLGVCVGDKYHYVYQNDESPKEYYIDIRDIA